MKLTIRQQANRIEKILNQSTTKEFKEGLNWYYDAHKFALELSELYNVKLIRVCHIISLLSPQTSWEKNKKNAIYFLNGKTDSIFSTQKTLKECERVLNGNFLIPDKRLKTFAFAESILTAGKTNKVVIDRHAFNVSQGRLKPIETVITPKRYKDAQKAYEIVSNKRGLNASELQAITWVTYKRIVGR